MICVHDFPRGEVSVKVGLMEFALMCTADMSLKEALEFLVSLAKEKKKEEEHDHGKTLKLFFTFEIVGKIVARSVVMRKINCVITIRPNN